MFARKNEQLRVYCPKTINGKFSDMMTEIIKIKKTVALAKSKNESRNLPIAIVFNELALEYRFNIQEKEVLKAVREMQQELPNDIWMAVAFNIYQINEKNNLYDGPANMSYLFTRDELVKPQPKRRCRNGDTMNLMRLSTANYAKSIDRWNTNGKEKAQREEPYSTLTMPNGYKLEYRICGDVGIGPIKQDKQTITLVSADGLNFNNKKFDLADMRKKVIVNDVWDEYGIRYLPKFLKFDGINVKEFWHEQLKTKKCKIVSVYDKPILIHSEKYDEMLKYVREYLQEEQRIRGLGI